MEKRAEDDFRAFKVRVMIHSELGSSGVASGRTSFVSQIRGDVKICLSAVIISSAAIFSCVLVELDGIGCGTRFILESVSRSFPECV